MVAVTIDRGNHSHPVPKGLGRLVEEALDAKGLAGEYRLRFGPRTRGTPHTPTFRARGIITQAGVELILKPGGNDTAHICWLAPSTMDAARCEELVNVLRDPADPDPEPEPDEPRQPPPPRPMVDLAEIEAELRAEEERLVMSGLEVDEGIKEREESIAVLRAEVDDLRARKERETAELAAVQDRLAHVKAVAEMVFQHVA